MPAMQLHTGATRDDVLEYIHQQLDSLRGVPVLGGLLLAKGRGSNSRLEGGALPPCFRCCLRTTGGMMRHERQAQFKAYVPNVTK